MRKRTKRDRPALLGGAPVASDSLPLVRPLLPRRSKLNAGIDEIYASRILTNQGRFAERLEAEISGFLGVRHCALFCNGTVALMSLLRALDLRGKVLVPSFTFAATVQALLWQGLEPVFIDIECKHFTIDPELIIRAITDDTSAILGVHLFGNPCDHHRLHELAREKNVRLIYDAAQALGSRYYGRAVGSLGDAEVLSFHATKVVHTGEGGAIVTNDSRLYQRLCRIRNFGFDGCLNCVDPGLNGKLSEFSALIGLLTMEEIEQSLSARKEVARKYTEELRRFPGLSSAASRTDPGRESNHSYFPVLIDPLEFGLSHVELSHALAAEGIVTRCYFYPPVHRMKYFRGRFSVSTGSLPHTDWASLQLLCLPFYADMRDEERQTVTRAIARCQENAEEIRSFLEDRIPGVWEPNTGSSLLREAPRSEKARESPRV